MFYPTKPGSEEFQDNARHLKKIGRDFQKWDSCQVLLGDHSSQADNGGFKITPVNMNKFKSPEAMYDKDADYSLSGSEPNQSLRSLDEDHHHYEVDQQYKRPKTTYVQKKQTNFVMLLE